MYISISTIVDTISGCVLLHHFQIQGVHEKLCFSEFTATHPLHVGKQLILARDLSVQSLLFSVQLLETQCWRGLQNLENSWEKPSFSAHPILFFFFLYSFHCY